jgi:hypothetical protein
MDETSTETLSVVVDREIPYFGCPLPLRLACSFYASPWDGGYLPLGWAFCRWSRSSSIQPRMTISAIILDADPSEDISVLGDPVHICAVIKDGKPVGQPRVVAPPF